MDGARLCVVDTALPLCHRKSSGAEKGGGFQRCKLVATLLQALCICGRGELLLDSLLCALAQVLQKCPVKDNRGIQTMCSVL